MGERNKEINSQKRSIKKRGTEKWNEKEKRIKNKKRNKMMWKKRERNRDVWHVERKSSSHGNPLVIKIAGREQYFVLRPDYQIRKK